MLTIDVIEPTSQAARLGLEPGDRIRSMNGYPTFDKLDFFYYIADESVQLDIMKANGEFVQFTVEKDFDDHLGIEVADFKMHACGSDCIFCFVDQNPGGMRPALYFRDGDYRYSFMFGHFVTLNNVGPRALQRIIDQKMSPINVSVHVTDPAMRQKLTGHRRAGELMDKLKKLAAGGINMHTQIVLCPGLNDGDYLRRSIEDLVALYPSVETLSVVPVGVTKYQKHKALQNRIEPAYAAQMIDFLEEYRGRFMAEYATCFVHPSDEWFLLANRYFPPAEAYEDYPQYENGVGMCRSLIDDMDFLCSQFPKRLSKKRTVTMVTGTLAAPVLQKYVAEKLNSIENVHLNILPVENEFYGHMVTVSGLLTGQDIRRSLQENRESLGDVVLLPPFCLNDDQLFLDDLTIADLQAVVLQGTSVKLGERNTADWLSQVLSRKIRF